MLVDGSLTKVKFCGVERAQDTTDTCDEPHAKDSTQSRFLPFTDLQVPDQKYWQHTNKEVLDGRDGRACNY
jgi:hypothetical protein